MSDEFGMPTIDNRPAHEVITDLRQQLASRDAEVAELREHLRRSNDSLADEMNISGNLREQVILYEQALLASWPEGAMGDAFDFWNAARNLAATEQKP